MSPNDHTNNFDLLRLVAAAQVVFVHSFGYTGLYESAPNWSRAIFEMVLLFPGVPVFFVISGFLIARSWERSNGNLRSYAWNRILRIYPALFVCFGISLVTLFAFGFLTREFVGSPTFTAWLLGQLSFVQFFNPEQLRGFGLGVVNGSLWTITVEIQFYLAVPVLYTIFFGKCKGTRGARYGLAVLGAASLLAYSVMDRGVAAAGGFRSAPFALKLLHNTLVPHLWMFMLGVFLHRRFDLIQSWIRNRALVWITAYAVAVFVIDRLAPPGFAAGTLALLLTRSLLALAVISAAYTIPSLSSRIVCSEDISYGLYIYHFLAINVLVELGMMDSLGSIGLVYCVTTVAAFASWRLVERPILAFKRNRPTLPAALEARPSPLS